jgi:prepilin-type N-terminal cleavage/methylation domain-containing protein
MNRGFTVVELLIAIIVISILASVTVVAFNGVRNRAANTQVAAAVNQTEKALRAHKEYTGNPLRANMAWFHSSITNMSGVCIANQWPNNAFMLANGAWGGTDWEIKAEYCGWFGHSAQTVDQATQMLNDEIANSSAKNLFASATSFSPITLSAVNADTSVSQVTYRALRYGFNNSSTNPASYVYYPVHGKTCPAPDTSIRNQETIWTSAGGSEWNGTFTTGGDYTANSTQLCVRTIRW